MNESPDKLLAAHPLAACADGELAPAAQADVVRRLSLDPTAARVVEEHLRLKACCARVLSDVEGPSDALARRCAAMAFQMPAEERPAEERPAAPAWRSPFRIGWPTAAAASVAFLAAGAMTVGYLASRPPAVASSARGSVIPVHYVSDLSRVHVTCARHLEQHESTDWPAEVASLRDPIRSYLRSERAYPDLSAAGYRFVGCAACGDPGKRGQRLVHLVYVGKTAADTISLFIEPDDGRNPDIREGACYGCGNADAAHPMLAWRSGNLLFFLVGNGAEPVKKVRETMGLPTVQVVAGP
ncbi:MAG TPA: hypothetical protein VF796_24565 [Humisphaera sp.]